MADKLYAFDFDGVICDSAEETGQTGWKAAITIWDDMPKQMPAEPGSAFKLVRPAIETGFEAILIMRLLFEKVSANSLLQQYHQFISSLLSRDKLHVDDLKQLFGQTRDAWIAADFNNWIAMNPLFSGVKNKLDTIAAEKLLIITTKQERFVDNILRANGFQLPARQIYGLDRQLNKQQVLHKVGADHPDSNILFIEDRLPTLMKTIEDESLNHIRLYLADWGYNTGADKQAAALVERIHMLGLNQLPEL